MSPLFDRHRPKSQQDTIHTQLNPERNKTHVGEQRVRYSGFYEETGLIRKEKSFQGRPIIGSDRPINGGVYLGAEVREAIVVDDKKDLLLDRIYQELLQRRAQAKEEKGETFKEGILEEVWELVNEVMPYDEAAVERVCSDLPEPDTKIQLSEFIGGGVCRHQALLTAYLLERLGKEQLVGGYVSVDRNYVPEKGGHAWARYENSGGVVYILDSAQGYLGTLGDIPETGDRWFYEREEDTNPRLKKLMQLKRKLMKITK